MSQIFRKGRHPDGSPIAAYDTYRPWSWHKSGGGDWSNYPTYSGRILDLKNRKPVGIAYFRDKLDPDLGTGFAIAVVPSHDPEKTVSGLTQLARALCDQGDRIDASGCLVRHTKIAKLAAGGDRSLTVHLKSIRVENARLIKGRSVLLLDDVTTSGHSLLACRRLLLDAGAADVDCVALGQTG